MKKVYTAIIRIAVEANNDSEACDAISGLLTGNEGLIDWQYNTNGSPENAGMFNLSEITEGELFKANTKLSDSAPNLFNALENLIIGIGMGWDLDGMIEIAKKALKEAEL